MYCDIPELKRCCFCLPLRYGLIGYGFLKLGALITFLTVNGGILFRYFLQDVFIAVLLILIFVDIVFTIVLVLGGYAKNAKILTMYMWYCIAVIVTYVVLQTVTILAVPYQYRTLNFVIQVVVYALIIIFFHAYLVFSIRSEINKLLKNKEEDIQLQGTTNPITDP